MTNRSSAAWGSLRGSVMRSQHLTRQSRRLQMPSRIVSQRYSVYSLYVSDMRPASRRLWRWRRSTTDGPRLSGEAASRALLAQIRKHHAWTPHEIQLGGRICRETVGPGVEGANTWDHDSGWRAAIGGRGREKESDAQDATRYGQRDRRAPVHPRRLTPEGDDPCHHDFGDQVMNTLQDPNWPRPSLEGHLRRFERRAEAQPQKRTEQDR